METLIFLTGIIGNVISVLMFLSPVGTFWRIIKNKSTEEFESLPYVCTLLSASLWTYYGIIKAREYLVATVNGFGIIVEFVYVALFLIYAPPNMKAKTALLVGILNVGFLAAAISVSRLAFKGNASIDAIGFICSGLNIIMYGSPLAAMKTVVTTKRVEYMPFLLSFFFSLNGATWTFYALLTNDYFLWVPNGVGFLLGIGQLVLYAIYRNTKPTYKNVNNSDVIGILEEGSQHESLISPSNED